MQIRYITDPRAIEQRLRGIPQQIHTRLLAGMWEAVIDLQTFIRTDELQGGILQSHTGNLSRAIVAEAESLGSDVVGTVGVDRTAPYGAVQELGGLNEYIIEPRQRLALRFMVAGSPVFAKRVIHPPLEATHFIQRALEAKQGSIEERLRASIRESIQ